MGFENFPKPKQPEEPNGSVAETAAILEQLKAKNSELQASEGRSPGELNPTEEEELKKTLESIQERE